MTASVLVTFVRHGESVANVEQVLSHRIGHHPLTEQGRRQAGAVAGTLARELAGAPVLVVTSPLARAVETATIVAGALGAEVVVDEGFRELDVGDLDGATGEAAWAVHDAVVDAWEAGRPDVAFPGGERLVDLVARFDAALRRSMSVAGSRRLVVVSHGGIMRAGMRGRFPGPATDGLGWVRNCSISEVLVHVRPDDLAAEIRAWDRSDADRADQPGR